MNYSGRVAIVTGASSGIGRQVAVDMARRGVHTIAVARREQQLRETLGEMQAGYAEFLKRKRIEQQVSETLGERQGHVSDFEIVVGDVGELSTAKRAIGLAREKWQRLDFLVNNAGISKRKHLLKITPEEAEQTIRINLIGAIYFILESLPLMVAQKEGYVVNVSSVAGKVANPREVIYTASKFGMAGLSEAMYFDLHRRGVHTILVNPGPIATEIWDKIESPAAYHGKFYPPSIVSDAVFECIEKKKHERTVPRIMGMVAVVKALLPGVIRRGTDRFDPDQPE